VLSGVCLSSLKAQSDDVATAMEVEGQVSVLQGDRLVALFQKSPAPVCHCTVKAKQQIVTGGDGHAIFQIADGSTFEVFPNSRVIFRDTFNFEELINLILGKIRVSVEHKNGPNHKKVSTPTAIISVRGTVFDVDVEDEDGTTNVTVEEGEVEVHNTRQPGPTRTVGEGNSIRIYPNQPLAKSGGTSPATPIFWDNVNGIIAGTVLRGPGAVGFPGGGIPGAQGDGGKNKKNPPPGAPPPPPGGGH
jgi:hypothetical protein